MHLLKYIGILKYFTRNPCIINVQYNNILLIKYNDKLILLGR